MPIQFDVGGEVADIARRTAELVRRVVLPEERPVHDGPEALRTRLQAAARAAGVFAPHVARRWGGLGLDLRGQAVVFAFHQALGYFKLAVIAEGIHARHLAGRTVGTGFGTAGSAVPALVAAGLNTLGRTK